jgi:hypothetical protein
MVYIWETSSWITAEVLLADERKRHYISKLAPTFHTVTLRLAHDLQPARPKILLTVHPKLRGDFATSEVCNVICVFKDLVTDLEVGFESENWHGGSPQCRKRS